AGTAGLAHDFTRFTSELDKLNRGEMSSLHHAEPRARLTPEQLAHAQSLITALTAALAPLERLSSKQPYDFTELAARHREILIALSRDNNGVAVAFEAQDGQA